MEDDNSVCIAQDLLRLLVVNISYALGAHKQLERILRVDISNPSLDFFFDLLLPLLTMRCEPEQLVLVRPEDGLVELQVNIEEDVIEVADYVLLPITDNNKE